ncbi:helix-turn-helix transcriptional regulator [Profundibacter sp.]|uniref:helix-turn-helix transcriptional regulator n=1 Tax=Profundibacter sp. TaxID=3101071 RepID=UPI003D114E8C
MSGNYVSGFLEAGDCIGIAEIWASQGAIATSEITEMADALDGLVKDSIIEGGLVRDGNSKEVLVYGLNAFVSDETRSAVHQNPEPFHSIRFLRDYIQTGRNVFLTVEEQAKGNAGEGLNAISVDYWQKTFDMTDPEFSKAMNAFLPIFLDMFKGFNIKTVTFEAETSHDQITREIGYTDRFDHQIGTRAHYLANRVIDGAAFHNQMIQMAMIYRQPRMRFSLFEQRVMRIALSGRTDQEIASMLGCSRDAVKQCWRGIYAHATETVPGFFNHTDTDRSQRGPEKRRILLAHIRENIQEIRPYSLRRDKRGVV